MTGLAAAAAVVWATTAFGDAALLSRQAAEVRLRRAGVFSLPARLHARRSGDPEGRDRAARLLRDFDTACVRLRGEADLLRYCWMKSDGSSLTEEDRDDVRGFEDARFHAMVVVAGRIGFARNRVGDPEATAIGMRNPIWWVNIVRTRAQRYPLTFVCRLAGLSVPLRQDVLR